MNDLFIPLLFIGICVVLVILIYIFVFFILNKKSKEESFKDKFEEERARGWRNYGREK